MYNGTDRIRHLRYGRSIAIPSTTPATIEAETSAVAGVESITITDSPQDVTEGESVVGDMAANEAPVIQSRAPEACRDQVIVRDSDESMPSPHSMRDEGRAIEPGLGFTPEQGPKTEGSEGEAEALVADVLPRPSTRFAVGDDGTYHPVARRVVSSVRTNTLGQSPLGRLSYMSLYDELNHINDECDDTNDLPRSRRTSTSSRAPSVSDVEIPDHELLEGIMDALD